MSTAMEGYRSIADATSAKTRCYTRMESPCSFGKTDCTCLDLISPIGISRKGFGRITDAPSVKDKPLQYPHFITYFECFHQHRKGIREIKTRRGMKQTRHQQSSKSTFSHGNSKNLQHCDSHRNELSRDCHPIGDVIIKSVATQFKRVIVTS